MLILIKFSLQNTLINFFDLLQVELEKIRKLFSSFGKAKLFVNYGINSLKSKPKQFLDFYQMLQINAAILYIIYAKKPAKAKP